LPAEFRKAVGLQKGDQVVVELDGGEIRISTIDGIVRRAQALTGRLLSGKSDASVDAFLADRGRTDTVMG